MLEVEHVEAEFAGEAALPAHEDRELFLAGDEGVHGPAVDELEVLVEVVSDLAVRELCVQREVGGDVALAIAYLLAVVADEAAEAPGLDRDALGDDLLHVAFGLEVVEDAGAVGLPIGLSLEGGDDGGDGVDAELSWR